MPDVVESLEGAAEEYRRDADDDRPLGAYAGLIAAYVGTLGALAFLGRRRLPGQLQTSDLVLGSLATFQLTRTISKDPIASPLRMAFTRYEGVSGPSELHEEVRGTGWRHAVGELLTCPFCLAQWTSTGLVAGLVVAPRATRTTMSILAMVTGSDFLQYAYAAAQRSER
jgi:hypothetical protein